MSRHEKLVQKIKSNPKSFSFSELKKLLIGFGYALDFGGKTSGSRVAFIHSETKHIVRLHKPHSGNEMKQYQIKQVVRELRDRGIV
jgi:hypothetical protein